MQNHGYPLISIHFHAFPCMSMDIHGYWTAARGKEGAYDLCPLAGSPFGSYGPQPFTTVEYAGLPATTTPCRPGRQAAGPSSPDPASMIDNFERRYLHVAIYIYISIYIYYIYIYIYNTAHCLSYIQYNGVLHIDQWSHRCRSKGLERKPISVFCPSCLLPFLLACLLHSPRSLSDCCPIFGVVWRVCTCNGLAVWDEFQK